jgi:hypothetical protein
MATEQRWLTLDELCSTLRLKRSTVLELAKKGCLAVIWGHSGRRVIDSRWLDPTAEYKEQLRLGAMIHQKNFPVPPDVSELALLTIREVAILCNWTIKTARNYVHKHQVEGIRMSKIHVYYPASMVREILWRRDRKTMSKQRAPFLLTDLIEFFQKRLAAEGADLPTDEEFLNDDAIQRKLQRIADMDESDALKARAEFADKVTLARKIVHILEQAKG